MPKNVEEAEGVEEDIIDTKEEIDRLSQLTSEERKAIEFYRICPDVFKESTRLLYKKTQDYNSEKIKDSAFKLDDARRHYFPFGDKSYAHMIHTKSQRIISLVDANGESNYEGIEDTLLDICNYAAFYYTYKKEEKEKE